MWLSRMDNRTLFACQILLTMVYSIAFLGMRRMYRPFPGTGPFALGFFSGFSAWNCAPRFVSHNRLREWNLLGWQHDPTDDGNW
ncbi:hypothetical protein HDF11_001320 [Tunturiibacter psychrotolerans]